MNPVREALNDVLSADATLAGLAPGGVHYRKAPSDATFPLVIFAKQDGRPDWCFDGEPLQWDLWLVKGVGQTAEAEDIAAQCAALLDNATLTITGRDHLYLRREGDVDMEEVVKGERFDHVGHIFRLVTEAT